MGDYTERLKTIIGRERIRTYRKGGKSVEQKLKKNGYRKPKEKEKRKKKKEEGKKRE